MAMVLGLYEVMAICAVIFALLTLATPLMVIAALVCGVLGLKSQYYKVAIAAMVFALIFLLVGMM